MTPESTSHSTRPSDRRRDPRARADWPVTLRVGDRHVEASEREPVRLRDLSASGVCFFLDRPIDEMTVVELQLELPDNGRSPARRIVAQGAVVRCAQISPRIEHFEVAVFLHNINEDDRRAIAAWVASHQAERADGREAEFRV
jgi:hypothetical protein